MECQKKLVAYFVTIDNMYFAFRYYVHELKGIKK